LANVGPEKASPEKPEAPQLETAAAAHPELLATALPVTTGLVENLIEAHNIELPVPAASVEARPKRRASALSLAVTALIVPGLFATVALPAYAVEPTDEISAAESSAALLRYVKADAQSVAVSADVAAVPVARDGFTATSVEELRAAQAAAAAAAAATVSAASASSGGGGGGLENPGLPGFSLDAIVSIAMQYQGVPYAAGGTTPAGFDCSGFVQYVYAQAGVSLPRTTGSQAAAGTRIARSAALPGDVVVMGGHNGIYLGGGRMIDSPVPGDVVGVHTIWTSNYSIVRFGI